MNFNQAFDSANPLPLPLHDTEEEEEEEEEEEAGYVKTTGYEEEEDSPC